MVPARSELESGELASFSPRSFRDTLIQRAPQFAGFNQHDAQEFVCAFLDLLHDENTRRGPDLIESALDVSALDRAPGPNMVCDATVAWRSHLHRNKSVIVDLFHGQSRSSRTCPCGHVSLKFDPFVYLSLPVRSEGTRESFSNLGQCLHAYTSTDRLSLENAWRCPRCSTPSEAGTKIDILRWPPLLIVHLKRFQFDVSCGASAKICDLVSFPVDRFDVSCFLPDGVRGNPVLYDLFAVINHSGSVSSGHYTAFIREGDSSMSSSVNAHVGDGWVCYDDHLLRNVDRSDLVSKAAYVLFYRRRTV